MILSTPPRRIPRLAIRGPLVLVAAALLIAAPGVAHPQESSDSGTPASKVAPLVAEGKQPPSSQTDIQVHPVIVVQISHQLQRNSVKLLNVVFRHRCTCYSLPLEEFLASHESDRFLSGAAA